MTTNPEIKNLETFYLIWLGDPIKVEVQQQLQIIINYLLVFEDEQKCCQYISSISKDDRIILIINYKLSQHFIPKIVHLPQIISIYIYSNDDKKINDHAMKNLNMVKGVISRSKELIERIQIDYNQRQYYNLDEKLPIQFFIPKETNLNNDFIYTQMLIDCLCCMPLFPDDKTQLIALCKQQYMNNPTELKIIEEFEKDYTAERSLWWYSGHLFLYRLMNKAIRVQNIDLLLLFRFYIRDLKHQLIKTKSFSPIRVYRTQLMSKEELELLTKYTGKLISINSFLLTSLNYEQTRSILCLFTSSDNMEKVFFQIDANPQPNNTKPYSNISTYNYFSNKEEVLFMIGSIFRIVHVDRDANGIWNIQLNLCSDQDHLLKSIIEQNKNELDIVDTDLLSFGFVLQNMGRLNEAETYYHHLLSKLPKDHDDISRCYHALGEVTQKKNAYNSSVKWYNKALEIDLHTLKKDDPNIATTYNSLAVLYSRKGDHNLALQTYEKALEIWKKAYGEDHPNVAMCYNNMGIIYQEAKVYADALESYHKAWNIREKCFPAEHSSLGQSHACIGNVHYILNHYDLALEHYNLSLEIFKKSSLPDQSHIALIHRNIGLVYLAKRELRQALSHMEKAATIYRRLFSTTHPFVMQIEKVIRQITSKL